MKRRILSAILAMSLIFGLAASVGITAKADEIIVTNGDFEYADYGDTSVYIFRYNGSDTNVDIPSEIEGKSVVTIGPHCFYDCTSLESVTIPESIIKIGSCAFSGCTSLKSVTIPKRVIEIGSWAFSDCKSLTKIEVSEGNDYFISENGVLFDKQKTKLIQYPVGKTDKSYDIPYGVSEICDCAFEWCTSLEKITIPNSIKSIGLAAFDDTGVYNNKSNWQDGALYIGQCLIDGTMHAYDEISGEYESLDKVKGDYAIKDGTKVIAEGAFDACDSLTSVIIPSSVEEVSNAAFRHCSSLKNVTIPNSITRIGDDAFMWSNIEEIEIPSSVTSIGEQAFGWCVSLKSAVIPESVETVGDYAFVGCLSLEDVTVPKSVTFMGRYVFDTCDSMTLHCYEGSLAHQYAIKNRIKYTLIDLKHGDLDSNGKINLGDLIAMRKYLAKWSININTANADCNADGRVNLLDLILLRKYLANWNVTLGGNVN